MYLTWLSRFLILVSLWPNTGMHYLGAFLATTIDYNEVYIMFKLTLPLQLRYSILQV